MLRELGRRLALGVRTHAHSVTEFHVGSTRGIGATTHTNSESWHLWCGRDFLSTLMSTEASDTKGHRARQLQPNAVTKRSNTGSVMV